MSQGNGDHELQKSSWHPPRIIYVDDDPNAASALIRFFRPFDVQFDWSCNGMQAYWMATTTKPDLIITDLQMPVASGDDLVNWIRGNRLLRETPVIVMTGVEERQANNRFRRCGAEEILLKPFHLEQLHESVSKYATLRRRPPRSRSRNSFPLTA